MALLALFPLLIFLGALGSYFGNAATTERFVGFILAFMPIDVAATPRPAIDKIVAARESGLLTFSAAFMLWSASNGIEAMRTALNRSYRSAETRSIWFRRTQSIVLVALGPLLWGLVTRFIRASAAERILWEATRYAGAAAFRSISKACPATT